jgi:hypothetical protein
MYTSSIKTDEKRKPSAAASARFRARKKRKETEREARIQTLEKENQKLLALVDHYQSECDRLRDIVDRTPGVSEHADGLPTTHPIATPSYLSLDPSLNYPQQQHHTEPTPNPEFHMLPGGLSDSTPCWNRQTTLPSLTRMLAGVGPYHSAPVGGMEATGQMEINRLDT